MTISEIKKKTPFDQITTIKLVSFKHEYPAILESDTIVAPAYDPGIPKTNRTVDLTKMFETKTLQNKLTDKILDVLVNYDNENRPSEIALCYEPRNGIVFFDKTDNIIGYVEICFECMRYKVEPNTMDVSNFCTEKFDVLKEIFTEAGISYGTAQSQED